MYPWSYIFQSRKIYVHKNESFYDLDLINYVINVKRMYILRLTLNKTSTFVFVNTVRLIDFNINTYSLMWD